MTTTAIKSRPIPFSAPMSRALLEWRKTQTRRMFKATELILTHPAVVKWDVRSGWAHAVPVSDAVAQQYVSAFPGPIRCPYGKPGDRLWLRENFRLPTSLDAMNCTQVAAQCEAANYPKPWAPVRYEADGATDNGDCMNHSGGFGSEWGRLRVARVMPRWASRITLEITDVRVERVQEISEEDAEAEGIRRTEGGWWAGPRDNYMVPSAAYRELWDSINGAGSWSSNPWVWVITFKRAAS